MNEIIRYRDTRNGTTFARVTCGQHAERKAYEADGYVALHIGSTTLPCDVCEEYREQTAAELGAGTQ